jgi:hypothetical protein
MRFQDTENTYGYNVEDMIENSCDGLEQRLIAKDLLYKFEKYLVDKRGRGFSLKERLEIATKEGWYHGSPLRLRHRAKGHTKSRKSKCSLPITYAVKSYFQDFLKDCRD